MRAALAIAAISLLILTGCNTLREAGEVAVKLSRQPTPEQITAQTASIDQNVAAADARLKEMQASGHKPTDAELREMVQQVVSGKVPTSAPVKNVPPPDDQEISVNLVFAGMNPGPSGKNLDFDFKALWGTYKVSSKQISMPARAGKSEAKLDLGEARLRVTPKVVSSVKGRYDIELTDPSGALIGRFNIAESGKQVDITARPSKYTAELTYFHPERRLTGYTIYKKGTRKAQLGVIFVGKGWSYVENGKKPDMSKGYLFPEVDMVVLPKGWLDGHDMKDTCNTLKRGEVAPGGGVCYS